MRLKHNKKRNTAFLYEVLVRELTKYIIKQNKFKIKQVSGLIKESFNRDTDLYKELNIYKPLYELKSMKAETAKNLIRESKAAHEKLSKKSIFREQSSLIKKINKTLGMSVYKSFVPNYKNIASVYSVFNLDMSPKDKIVLEEKIHNSLTSSCDGRSDDLHHMDDIVYRSFIEKFNSKYSSRLTEGQKTLLNKYISSFGDNGLELKAFLNEEIGALKKIIKKSYNNKEIKEEGLAGKLQDVADILETLGQKPIDESTIRAVIKIQNLTKELEEDDS